MGKKLSNLIIKNPDSSPTKNNSAIKTKPAANCESPMTQTILK